jgi:pimeloyl-ACP methyl ester carboxylesterase
VLLKATFYPGTKGNKTVPIVILHQLKGNRGEYKDLALALQKKGHAVMVPDLRGHGESTVQTRGRQKIELNSTRITKNDLQLMINEDMEAVRDYLFERNNEDELNLNKLGLIGVEMGAVVAANWALYDWSRDPLTTYQNGRDVKALMLISPDWSIRGLSLAPAIDNSKLQQKLSILLVAGAQDKKSLEALEKIEAKLARYHPEPPKEEIAEKKTLFVVKLPTSLQSSKLVNQAELKTDQIVSAFIDLRLVKPTFAWSLRDVPRR